MESSVANVSLVEKNEKLAWQAPDLTVLDLNLETADGLFPIPNMGIASMVS